MKPFVSTGTGHRSILAPFANSQQSPDTGKGTEADKDPRGFVPVAAANASNLSPLQSPALRSPQLSSHQMLKNVGATPMEQLYVAVRQGSVVALDGVAEYFKSLLASSVLMSDQEARLASLLQRPIQLAGAYELGLDIVNELPLSKRIDALEKLEKIELPLGELLRSFGGDESMWSVALHGSTAKHVAYGDTKFRDIDLVITVPDAPARKKAFVLENFSIFILRHVGMDVVRGQLSQSDIDKIAAFYIHDEKLIGQDVIKWRLNGARRQDQVDIVLRSSAAKSVDFDELTSLLSVDDILRGRPTLQGPGRQLEYLLSDYNLVIFSRKMVHGLPRIVKHFQKYPDRRIVQTQEIDHALNDASEEELKNIAARLLEKPTSQLAKLFIFQCNEHGATGPTLEYYRSLERDAMARILRESLQIDKRLLSEQELQNIWQELQSYQNTPETWALRALLCGRLKTFLDATEPLSLEIHSVSESDLTQSSASNSPDVSEVEFKKPFDPTLYVAVPRKAKRLHIKQNTEPLAPAKTVVSHAPSAPLSLADRLIASFSDSAAQHGSIKAEFNASTSIEMERVLECLVSHIATSSEQRNLALKTGIDLAWHLPDIKSRNHLSINFTKSLARRLGALPVLQAIIECVPGPKHAHHYPSHIVKAIRAIAQEFPHTGPLSEVQLHLIMHEIVFNLVRSPSPDNWEVATHCTVMLQATFGHTKEQRYAFECRLYSKASDFLRSHYPHLQEPSFPAEKYNIELLLSVALWNWQRTSDLAEKQWKKSAKPQRSIANSSHAEASQLVSGLLSNLNKAYGILLWKCSDGMPGSNLENIPSVLFDELMLNANRSPLSSIRKKRHVRMFVYDLERFVLATPNHFMIPLMIQAIRQVQSQEPNLRMTMPTLEYVHLESRKHSDAAKKELIAAYPRFFEPRSLDFRNASVEIASQLYPVVRKFRRGLGLQETFMAMGTLTKLMWAWVWHRSVRRIWLTPAVLLVVSLNLAVYTLRLWLNKGTQNSSDR